MSKILQRAVQVNSKYTLDFKKYLINTKLNKVESFIHDCPLNPQSNTKTASMVVEIPRGEQGKFEISTKLRGNPIVQDTKKGKLRFINNIFPFMGYPVNYGALPQTWEDTTLGVTIGEKEVFGDNDPLDVCEISDDINCVGDIKEVKILGCLAMIDDGELDWKLLAISSTHSLAKKLNGPQDVELYMPGLLHNLKTWLKNYKLPMNKPVNEFGYENEGVDGWLDAQKAWEVVEECHSRWFELVKGNVKAEGVPTIENWSLESSPGFNKENMVLSRDEIEIEAEPIPVEAKEIFYYNN